MLGPSVFITASSTSRHPGKFFEPSGMSACIRKGDLSVDRHSATAVSVCVRRVRAARAVPVCSSRGAGRRRERDLETRRTHWLQLEFHRYTCPVCPVCPVCSVAMDRGAAIQVSGRSSRMHAKDVLIGTIEQAGWVTARLLQDLSDADLLIRPVPGMNHVAWQLGHLVLSVHDKLTVLSPPEPRPIPSLPVGFSEIHSAKVAATEPRHGATGWCSKREYLALMTTMRGATITAIRAIPDADLDLPAPEALRTYTPTIGAVLNLIGTHEFMHHGQIVALRRRLGKPVLM